MSSNDPNIQSTSGASGPQYIPSISRETEINYITGKPISDSISSSSATLNLSIPAAFSPLPDLNTNPNINLKKTQEAIQKDIQEIMSSADPSQFQALSSLYAFTGDLNKSALTTASILANFNQQQAQLNAAQQEQAASSVNTITSLVEESGKLQQQINQVTQAIKDAETSKNSSQTNLTNLNNQITQAYQIAQSGQSQSQSNQYVQLFSRINTINLQIQPSIPTPTNLSSLVNWLNAATDGKHLIGNQPVTSLEELLPGTSISSNATLASIASGAISTYNENEKNISEQNTTITGSQSTIQTLNNQLSDNKNQQLIAVNNLLGCLNMPAINSTNQATFLAGQAARATELASKIVEIVGKQNVNEQDLGIEALRAFIAIQALINKSNANNQIELAQQGQKTSLLNMNEASFQLSLADQLAAVAKEIQDNQNEANDVQSQITKLGYAADALGAALAVATVADIFTFGACSGAVAALGVALGAVLIAKGALQVKLSGIESKISDEQKQEAGLGRDLANVKTANEQLSQAASSFTDLISQVSKAITAATKEAGAAIDAFGQSSDNLTQG